MTLLLNIYTEESTGAKRTFVTEMVHSDRNISYTSDTNNVRNQLDVYYSNKAGLRNVLVFAHGGAWETGGKDIYRFLGRNFVRKGLVAVIINYSLSPNPIGRIANDGTAAVVWVVQNIANYGGNPSRIFLMGHSAGGHLIALINADRRFFAQYGLSNPIAGLVLLDAFGLDMYEYLNEPSSPSDRFYQTFLRVFSTNPRQWYRASPMRYAKHIRNPQLILVGERTYPTIQRQNRRLFQYLVSTAQTRAEFHQIPERSHFAMISSMFFSGNQQYDLILDFLRRN